MPHDFADMVLELACPCPWCAALSSKTLGWNSDDSGVCSLSVLFNLRKLSLDSVAFSLAALQPVATRLQSLEITNTRLRGSADGFLRAGWTALCYLRFRSSRVVDDILTAVYLPALEALDVISFQHKGGILQQDQLCLPQLCKLTFLLHSSQMRVSEGGRQSCSFLNLPRLASLVLPYFPEFRIDLDLPASLEHLTLQDFAGGEDIDLKQLLLEVIKGIKSGARLCSLTCAGTAPSHHPEGMPWGASSVAYYRDLGEQLRGLKSLLVCGRAWTLLSAVGAVACSAPDLTHLQFRVNGHPHPDVMELPPVSSASLESITVGFELFSWHRGPPPPVVLTILPGCTQLRDVRVQFYYNTPKEGTSVKIRCHCTSQRCIIPLDAAGLEEVGVRFLQMPLSSQGVQTYTVICTCQAAGPEQGLRWGHLVMPGVL